MKKMILTAATLAILCSCGGQKTEVGDAQDSLVEVTPENPDELLDTAKVETLTPEETKVEMDKIQAKTLWEKLKARYNDAKAASGKNDAAGVTGAASGAVNDVSKAVGKDGAVNKKAEEVNTKVQETQQKVNETKEAAKTTVNNVKEAANAFKNLGKKE